MSNQPNENSEMSYEAKNADAPMEPIESSDGSFSPEESLSDTASEASMETNPDPSVGELDSLRAEVRRLQEQLDQQKREQAEAMSELEDFHRLFPDVSIRSIPPAVWQNRERGIPLNAAYALYERELQSSRAKAEAINTQNAVRSPGKVGVGTANEYFSPDEVRKMTPKQVHENFSKIRESMKSWADR